MTAGAGYVKGNNTKAVLTKEPLIVAPEVMQEASVVS